MADHFVKKASLLAQPSIAVVELVRDLFDAGYHMVLVSNLGKGEFDGWPESDIAQYFRATILSGEIGYAKPNAKIYRQCMSALNLRADEIAFVGDGASNELEGAAAMGMFPIWATWYLERWPDDRIRNVVGNGTSPYVRVRQPAELLPILEGIA